MKRKKDKYAYKTVKDLINKKMSVFRGATGRWGKLWYRTKWRDKKKQNILCMNKKVIRKGMQERKPKWGFLKSYISNKN